MKAILTKQNDNGTYDSVGMRNRSIVSNYATKKGLLRFAVKPFGNGRKVRVEILGSSIYDKPVETFEVNT